MPITTSDYARSEKSFLMSNPPSTIPLKITVQRNSPNVLTYLDRISLNTKRDLVFYGSKWFQKPYRTQSGIGEFVVSNYPSTGFLWDLSDRHNPKKIDGVLLEMNLALSIPCLTQSTSFLMEEHF